MAGFFFIVVAVLGTLSSSVFLAMALLGVLKFRRDAKRQERYAASIVEEEWPAVSLLKPLHGMEPQLRANIESFFEQDYPHYEILFAVDGADDAALPLAQELCAKYPQIPSQVIITGEPPWPNPPAYAFFEMAQRAKYPILVTSDSDVIVDKSYLRAVVPPLMQQENGMLTCVYRGQNVGGIWSQMDAVGMSVEMTAGVLVANLMEGMRFGLGPTIAVRRDALDAIGGYRMLADYFANDFMIGNLIAKSGYTVVLSRHIISHVVSPMTFRKMWQRQLRWATSTRRSRPKGHLGTGLVFAVPYGIAGWIGGTMLHHPWAGAAFLAWSIGNRMVESLTVGWMVTRARECLTQPWLYPLRDLLGFLVWIASYMTRRSQWRDGSFELVADGRILLRDRDGNVVRMGTSS